MREERNVRIAELFNDALALEPSERSPFLGRECTGDEELRLRVNDLLGAYSEVKTLGPISQGSGSGELMDSTSLLALGERYQDIKLIGQGGMGIVFRALDREIDKVVALKVLHPWLASDQRAMEQFRNEIRLALDITHKNVCRTYGLERFERIILISMEYVEGENLRCVLQRTKEIPAVEASEWALEICDALAAAHDRKVIHRDLKPENIMIDREGHVRVMDFGIARLIGTGELTSGAVIGTPRYMSPEQALGRLAGPASDVYSLGLVLYELFARRQRDPERPVSPREVNSKVPIRIDRAILKCLRDEPSERFQSTRELATALAGRHEGWSHQERLRRRLAVAAFGVVALLAFVVSAIDWRKPTTQLPGTSSKQQVPTPVSALPKAAAVSTVRDIKDPTNPQSLNASGPKGSAVQPRKTGKPQISSTLEGVWSANISDAKSSAAVQFNLVQDPGGVVTGTYTSSLGGGGRVKGQFNGGVLKFELIQSIQGCPGVFRGTANVAGIKGTGFYAGNDCLGDHGHGTFTMTKGLEALTDREELRRLGLLEYLDSKLLVWTEERARLIMGEPRGYREGYDESHNVTSTIEAFADPTFATRVVELSFDSKSRRLTNVYLYPNRATWDDCKKLWGDDVTIKANVDGTKFHIYNSRRLNVLLDKDDNVINLGLYPRP